MPQVTGLGAECATPSAPVIAAGAGAGNLGAGTYSYKVTFVTSHGETAASAGSNPIIATASSSMKVTIPVSQDTSVTGRNLYRTEADGSDYLFLVSVDNNTDTQVIDTLGDDDLGEALAPATSTALSAQVMKGFFNFSGPLGFNAANLVADGSDHTDATPIGYNNLVYATGAENAGLILPVINDSLIGLTIVVHNWNAEDPLKVYPAAGQTINGGTADVAVSQAAGEVKIYKATDASDWTQS